jgi:hypothetical protein
MFTIKATPRNNNGSMSFTIPADIVKELNIKHGDQYQVSAKKNSKKGHEIVFVTIPA